MRMEKSAPTTDKVVPPRGAIEEKEARLERHLVVMEKILESADKLLWANPKLGWPDLVEKILDAGRLSGTEPSRVQRQWVEEKVQQWIEDVAKVIDLYADLGHEWINTTISPENEASWAKATDDFNAVCAASEEPWRLVETNVHVQRALLQYLPTKSKDPAKFKFYADHPPLLVIECEDDADFEKFNGANNFSSGAVGLAFRDNWFQHWSSSMGDVLRGAIAVVKKAEPKDVRNHELQHLFYGKYVVDKKAADINAIDELAAYLKTGEYRDDEAAIFSHEHDSTLALLAHKYEPDWLAVKDELWRLNTFEVDAKALWPRVAICDSLPVLTKRLRKINTDSVVPDYIYAIRVHRHFDCFLRCGDRLSSEQREFLRKKCDDIMLSQMLGESLADIKRICAALDVDTADQYSRQHGNFALNNLLTAMTASLERVKQIFPDWQKMKICDATDPAARQWQKVGISDYNSGLFVLRQTLRKMLPKFNDQITWPSDDSDGETLKSFTDKMTAVADVTKMTFTAFSNYHHLPMFGLKEDKIDTYIKERAKKNDLRETSMAEIAEAVAELLRLCKEEAEWLWALANEVDRVFDKLGEKYLEPKGAAGAGLGSKDDMPQDEKDIMAMWTPVRSEIFSKMRKVNIFQIRQEMEARWNATKRAIKERHPNFEFFDIGTNIQ